MAINFFTKIFNSINNSGVLNYCNKNDTMSVKELKICEGS